MSFVITTAVKKIAKLKKRIKVVQGGTSAGKTVGILEVLIDKCQAEDKQGDITSVTSESFPHLKRGAIRDFLAIMQAQNYFVPERWNKTDYIYTFETGAILEFFSSDQPSKVRGPRRKRLFMNECNNMPFETFEQLEIRTTDEIYLDYNPVSEFWVQLELLGKRDDVDFLIVNYLDNEALSLEIVKSIEQRKNRPGWWKVYGLGELGEVEGRIYTGWNEIDTIPNEARLERYGIDFGYHPDPCAIVAVYYYNGGYILDEVAYQLEMSNREIANTLKNLPKALCVADSAEPKSIDELKMYGLNVVPTNKGADSVRHGIRAVQDQRISVTKRSASLLKEYRNYLWAVDKEGHILPGIPEGGNDHLCFAKGTLVNGRPIEEIGVQTGIENVYEYEIAGEKLRATKNHPVLTHRGLVNVDAVRYDDVIWKEKRLFMTASNGIDTQTVIKGLKGVTISALRRLIEAKERDFTDIFGDKQMEKFQPNIIYTILMAIPSIINLLTWSLYSAVNTLATIGLRKSGSGLKRISKELLSWLPNGLKLQSAGSNGLRWDTPISTSYLTSELSQDSVTYAEMSTKQKIWGKIDSVISTVVKKHYVGREPVYNLKTKSGMYLANGIMVSNCDAVRYAINSLVPVIRRREMFPQSVSTLKQKTNIAI